MPKLKELLLSEGVFANKSLGQNFIYDENILGKIADTQKDQKVCVEIGVGPGGLTLQLAKKCERVIGFEIDTKFAPIYNEIFKDKNIEIVFDDFLNIDLDEFFKRKINGSFGVCANLPYYITTPILMKLLDSNLPITNITVLVQKEVADRIVSPPGSKKYGMLSVMVQCRGTAKKLFDLRPGAFSPPPSVDSSLIQITIEDNIISSDIDKYRECVKSAFSQRRKQLKGNIASKYGLSKSEAEKILEDIRVKATARAEELSVLDFDKLTKELNNYKG